MNNAFRYLAPLGRLLLVILFLWSGWGKITGYAGTQGYMEAMGVPGFLLPLVIALEILGSIAIVVGFKTRYVALLMAIFTFLSAILFHADFGDQNQMMNFMKNLSITGGFLMLAANGAGAFAMDKEENVYAVNRDGRTS